MGDTLAENRQDERLAPVLHIPFTDMITGTFLVWAMTLNEAGTFEEVTRTPKDVFCCFEEDE